MVKMVSVDEVVEAYQESLSHLTFNSKPVISNLTELANDYRAKFSPVIVRLIEDRIKKVPVEQKMPCLYLIDSIVKNHPVPYKDLFQQNLVALFTHVFGVVVDVKIRLSMYKLRSTWVDVFSPARLYQLDMKVRKELDPKWPVASTPPVPVTSSKSAVPSSGPNIHINPNVFNRQRSAVEEDPVLKLQREMQEKKMELMRLEQQKLEIELETARQAVKKARESSSAVNSSTTNTTTTTSSSSSSSSLNVGHQQKDPKKSRDPRGSKTSTKSSSDSSHRPSSPAPKPTSATKLEQESRNSPTKSPKSTKIESSSKDTTPPPPPTIRGDFKGNSSPIKSAKIAPKSPSSNATETENSLGKDISNKVRKRKEEEHGEGRKGKSSKQRRIESKRSSNTSGNNSSHNRSSRTPSPPASSSSSSNRKFRIPKKRPASPSVQQQQQQGFSEEGPHVEFNKGKRLVNPNNRMGKRKNNRSLENKTKLNMDLFGEDAVRGRRNESLPSPSAGWAQFKETNPDEYRRPLGPSVDGASHLESEDGYRGGPRATRIFRPPHQRNFNNGPPGGGGPMDFGIRMRGPLTPGQIEDMKAMERLTQTADPHTIETKIIPLIISQAQANFRDQSITQEQFQDLVRQAKVLKEYAMVKQAQMRENNKENNLGGSGPWQNPPQGMGPPNMMRPMAMPPHPMRMMGPPVRPFPPMVSGPRAPMHMDPSGAAPAPVDMMRDQVVINTKRDLPLANEEDLDLIKFDPIKSIDIDEHPRDIRYFEETATCVMGDNDVRELSFKKIPPPATRRVIIDDNPNIVPPLELDVNDYTDFMLDGVKHKIKIGAPTRELWVDGQWYQCFFGNSIRIRIGQNFHTVFLEGPAPSVRIGDQSRSDLCAGFVHLVTDADVEGQRTIYLDAKPQQLDIDGKPHVLRFVEGLSTLLINGHPFKTNFGGNPLVIYVNGMPHYLRLTALPPGVRVGHVNIRNMMDRNGKIPQFEDEGARSPNNNNENNGQEGGFDSEGQSAAFDHLLSLFPASHKANRDTDTASESDYCVKTEGGSKNSSANIKSENLPAISPAAKAVTDVNQLWNQLLGAGLVTTHNSASDSNAQSGIPGLETDKKEETNSAKPATKVKDTAVTEVKPSNDKNKENTALKKPVEVKPIILKSHHSSLKTRQQAIINQLYDPSALQCKNCGLRYKSGDMIAYSQHLDWHFRMRRKDKENAKRAQSRKWYFEKNDWIISDEIVEEDKENDADSKALGGPVTSSDAPTVPILENNGEPGEGVCPVCNEEFEYFYKQEGNTSKDDQDDGQWHYSNAIRPEDESEKVYHPQCYEDRKASNMSTLSHEESMEEESEQSNLKEESMTEDNEDTKEVKKEEVEEEPMETDQPEESKPIETYVKKEEEIKEEAVEANDAKETAEKMEIQESAEKENGTGEENEKCKMVEIKKEFPDEALQTTEISSTADEETVVAVKMENGENDQPGQVEEDSKEVKDPETNEKEGEKVESESKPEEEEESVTLDDHDSASNPVLLHQLPNPAGPLGIRINITSQVDKLERRESVKSAHLSEIEESEFDSEAIVQERVDTESEQDLKPKMAGKKFTEFPMQKKDGELSGLCSIM